MYGALADTCLEHRIQVLLILYVVFFIVFYKISFILLKLEMISCRTLKKFVKNRIMFWNSQNLCDRAEVQLHAYSILLLISYQFLFILLFLLELKVG